MAGTGAIFRLTNAGDTEVSVTSVDKIEWGTGAVTPDSRTQVQSIRYRWTRDITPHPNPNKEMNKKQDGKLRDRQVIISGYLKDSDSAIAAVNLSNWLSQANTTTDFPSGRFGIRVDSLTNLDISPSAGTGYLLEEAVIELPEDSPTEATFTITMTLNGTHP